MSLQGFLFTWLLVGVLERPADEAGFARSLAEFPPLIVLLFGGILGDRVNGRTFLTLMHFLIERRTVCTGNVTGMHPENTHNILF